MEKELDFHFSGWATRNDLLCGDGRTIRKNAFKDNDGQTVPLIWNHDHSTSEAVLGHALLENRDEGVYAYCTFNNTDNGKHAKELVENGDVRSLSIYANKLKQIGGDVIHGSIRELSLVLAGANPGAYIDFVMAHGDDGEESEGLYANYDENALVVRHSQEPKKVEKQEDTTVAEETKKEESTKVEETSENETVQDVIDTMTDKQKNVMYLVVGQAVEDALNEKDNENENGGKDMKHNVFENDERNNEGVLSHSDQQEIIALAKQSNVGSLKAAMSIYAEEKSLAHGFEEIAQLFPDYKDVHPGAPELLERDQSWVASVMKKAHKSPISRIRTRQADARANELRAKGYNDRKVAKSLSGDIKLIMRTTDPQTVYRRDELHRDDITDITDFDVVAYQKVVMKHNMEEDIALAALIGDGREDTDPDKIHENHIRSIWNDEELYTIHADVDIAAAKEELQGSNTGANFGENYIYSEAVVTAALYAREKYKGKGTPDFYCEPHLLNVMLLARDLNGRRIYDSKAELAKALNVGEIHTVEQMAGKTRTDKEGKVHKLLGLFVNMANYQFGATKGGEITDFEDFDIDFNKYKYLMEARLSGALTEIASAIALEEPVKE